MTRRALIAIVTAVLASLLMTAPGALAAGDPSSTALSCSPAALPTTTATTCTVTVSDPATTPVTETPIGTVTATASPSTGAFSDSGSCALPASTTGTSATCQFTFTPAAGGSYTITAQFPGDFNHAASTGSATVSAVDQTATSFSCTAASVSINSSTTCTATVTDPTSNRPPIGTVSFASAPTTGTFGAPGICRWTPAGAGGSAACQVTFAPTAAGPYTLTASYGGDSSHTASSGSTALTATSTLAGGGPGSSGTGSGTVSLGSSTSPGPAPIATPGVLAIGKRAKVSTKHVAAVKLSCTGATGLSCVGTVTITANVKVKVKTKVKVKVRVKVKRHGKTHVKTKTKTKTKLVKETETITVGHVSFSLATGTAGTIPVKLSRAARTALKTARHGILKTNASAGAVTAVVKLSTAKHKHHKKHKRHHHRKKH